MKSVILSSLFCAASICAAAPANGLMLHATFDKFTTVPEIAVDKTARGIPADLSNRKFAGPVGNAVCLQNTEYLDYSKNNFDPQKGTLMFRTSPQNWKVADGKSYQLFFELRSNDCRYFIYRGMGAPNLLTFIVMGKGKVTGTSCPVTHWKPGTWHHVAITWNSEGIQIFIDGRASRFTKYKEGFTLPKKLNHCAIRFNCHLGWRHNKEWKTAYDDIQIYNTCLTPAQIADAVKKPQQIIKAAQK